MGIFNLIETIKEQFIQKPDFLKLDPMHNTQGLANTKIAQHSSSYFQS